MIAERKAFFFIVFLRHIGQRSPVSVVHRGRKWPSSVIRCGNGVGYLRATEWP